MDGTSSDTGLELVSMVFLEDEAGKRAHHNALERKRRDHIKDSFYCLRDAVPQLRGEKASRALILNKATDYIKCLKTKNMSHKKDIDDIKRQNDVLEQEIDKIIKLNNSLGKDRIELFGEDFVISNSTPSNKMERSEKDVEETGVEKEGVENKATVLKLTKPLVVKSDGIVEGGGDTKAVSKIALPPGAIKSGGTIQIPASALAKALPNGFKNVTAIYKQTGTNKPIRLQIFSPAAKKVGVAKGSESVERRPGDNEPRTPLNQPLYAKPRPQPPQQTVPTGAMGGGDGCPVSEADTSPLPPHHEAGGELSAVEVKTELDLSEYDSYKQTEKKYSGKPNNEFKLPPRGNTRVSRLHPHRNKYQPVNQALARDPSAMATISESELAFLTRPNSNPGPTTTTTTTTTTASTLEMAKERSKIEHGNIPILYKGSLLSDRDKDEEDLEPVHKPVLYGPRAMDGSRPFACHICGKSFNMLSSLKVHEHIHVPVKKKPYPCDLCHRSFMTLRILSQHKESHFGRISTFHRQAALCRKRNTETSSRSRGVSYATYPQGIKSAASQNPHSPRTSITNIFHVRASSGGAGDATTEKSYVTITPSKSVFLPRPSSTSSSTSSKPGNQRILPTTRVRQGQVIVQARPGIAASAYKVRTKAEAEETRNFGKVVPIKREPEAPIDKDDKKGKEEESSKS